jgi:ATP-dependent metalloprotease
LNAGNLSYIQNPYTRKNGPFKLWVREHRRYFFSFLNRDQIRDKANTAPNDPAIQAQYLKSLNDAKEYLLVIDRVISKRYALNDEGLAEYTKALAFTGQLHANSFKDIRTTPVAATTAAEPADAAKVEGAEENTATGSEEAKNAANAKATANTPIVQQPIYSQSSPMPVVLVSGFWAKIFPFLMPFWWLAVIWVFIKFLSSGEKETISFFDIPSHHDRAVVVNTRFSDVRGCDEAKSELQEVVAYLKNPTAFTSIGAQLPKGVLLVGEPGTGKTLLARAIAGEAGVPFFYCSGSSFDEMYVGVGSKRVRSLFEDAKKNSPCIVFIDEIDAVGGKRTKWNSGTKDSTLQMLLTELDGFEKNEGIIVIAATNMPDSLDSALTRPGRFDKQVVVPIPDVKGRKEILDLYLSKVTVAPDVDSHRIARATPGFTGADLNQLINLAAIKAVVQGKKEVTLSVIEETRDDIWMGRMRRSAVVDEATRSMTAYHEGGHALVSLCVEGSDPIHKATIIQRGHALGMVSHLPEGDQLSRSRKQMMAQLAVCMAGRAAEEVVYGEHEVTSGASSDFQTATSLAYSMVTKWGMSEKVGFIHISPDRKISPEQRQVIDSEVRRLLDERYKFAKQLLIDNRKDLDAIAKLLLEKETVNGEELKTLVGK